ncbi:30S ribosomal protein S18 [bacterium]|jgi:small subunit ribosomal protein S18|nr:30S ribosomal protein S18 [bacterium]MBT4894451.1 30S ribosomal protein S18 [bacterium]
MNKNFFTQNNIKHIDYKDVELLKTFLKTHGRITQRMNTGASAGEQRKLAQAIKRARFMALLPFVME